MTFSPTLEQVSIMAAAGRGENLMVNAMAGCAKTTTLTLMAKAMPLRPSLALAFNVKIKKELESRFPSHFDVKTLNGLGHAAWGRAIGKRCSVEEKKIGNLLKQVLKDENIKDTDADTFSTVIQLVRRARTAGMVPADIEQFEGLIPDDDEGWELIGDSLYLDLSEMQIFLARKVLHHSVIQSFSGVLDYDDQIYMSALFGGVFPKYPVVMVDEAQDLSPLNHIQLQKCALSQVIVVGDPRQAIYAFRGADSSSMDNLRKMRESWTDLPLSTTFRCPKTIVARQQDHAPGFNAAESAPEGEFSILDQWGIKQVLERPGEIALLCRNNAPLIGTALKIIASGHGCTVMGREIGKALVKQLKDLTSESDSAEVAIDKIEVWATEQISKARANGKEERVAIVQDKRDCLQVVLNHKDISNVATATHALTQMFDSANLRITLATGHKAKGLEWTNIIHLDPWRIPSKYARAAHEQGNPIPMEQDLNLRYVIETRSKSVLLNANVEDML